MGKTRTHQHHHLSVLSPDASQLLNSVDRAIQKSRFVQNNERSALAQPCAAFMPRGGKGRMITQAEGRAAGSTRNRDVLKGEPATAKIRGTRQWWFSHPIFFRPSPLVFSLSILSVCFARSTLCNLLLSSTLSSLQSSPLSSPLLRSPLSSKRTAPDLCRVRDPSRMVWRATITRQTGDVPRDEYRARFVTRSQLYTSSKIPLARVAGDHFV